MKLFPIDHLSRELWSELHAVEPYPPGVGSVPEQIAGTSFFPGGTGLWCEARSEVPPLPVGGIMVLGHDFHSREGYEWAKRNIVENLNTATWRHLLSLLLAAQIAPETCFFTNVYMGLREDKATTGRFPGSKDPEFVKRCRQFFIRQLQVQRPRLILALGAYVPPFLAPLSPELTVWDRWYGFRKLDEVGRSTIAGASFPSAGHGCDLVTLTHPCLRPANVGRRSWQSLRGDAAELQMVRHALRPAGPDVTA